MCIISYSNKFKSTMNSIEKKFAVVIKDVLGINEVLVQKNDVGVIVEESQEISSVFFVRIWQKVELKNSDFEVFDVKKTGDAFSKKICNVCHKLLNTIEFDKNQNGINNRSVRRPSCQNCRKLIDGVGVKTKLKNEWLKKKPDKEPYECPICLKRTIAGVTSKLVLDHDHTTGEVRDWICDSCNTGIGRFKDDVEILKRAINFVEPKK